MKNRMLEIKINEEEKEHISIKIQGSFLKLINNFGVKIINDNIKQIGDIIEKLDEDYTGKIMEINDGKDIIEIWII